MITRFASLTSQFTIALLFLFGVAACGGGGGGGGGFIPDEGEEPGEGELSPVTITTTALPNAIDGVQYTTLVQATGGEEPYASTKR
jgi:hypothetical protein